MPNDTSIDVLKTEYISTSDYLKNIDTSYTRLILILCALALTLTIIVYQHDLRPPKWAVVKIDLDKWSKLTSSEVREASYVHLVLRNIPKERRRVLTSAIEKSGVQESIPLGMDMMRVSKFLSDNVYGIDFLEIGEIEKRLSIMLEQPNVTILSDLTRIHYEGGPLTQGTSLRDAFFSDYRLGQHKALKGFAYDPNRPIVEFVSAVRDAIAKIKDKYADADVAWRTFSTGFLEKYNLGGWTWAAWRDLDDSTVSKWRTIESESNQRFDIASLNQMSKGMGADRVTWESVVNSVRSDVTKELRKSEEEGRSKAKVFDVELTLPIGLILIFFPVGFFAGNVLLSSVAAKRRLAYSAMVDLAERLDQATSSDTLRARYADDPSQRSSLWKMLSGNQWDPILAERPNFIDHMMYMALYWSLGLYVMGYTFWLTWIEKVKLIGEFDGYLAVLVIAISGLLTLLVCGRLRNVGIVAKPKRELIARHPPLSQ